MAATFYTGGANTATFTLTNTKKQAETFSIQVLLNPGAILVGSKSSVAVPANSSMTVNIPTTMPSTAGIYTSSVVAMSGSTTIILTSVNTVTVIAPNIFMNLATWDSSIQTGGTINPGVHTLTVPVTFVPAGMTYQVYALVGAIGSPAIAVSVNYPNSAVVVSNGLVQNAALMFLIPASIGQYVVEAFVTYAGCPAPVGVEVGSINVALPYQAPPPCTSCNTCNICMACASCDLICMSCYSCQTCQNACEAACMGCYWGCQSCQGCENCDCEACASCNAGT